MLAEAGQRGEKTFTWIPCAEDRMGFVAGSPCVFSSPAIPPLLCVVCARPQRCRCGVPIKPSSVMRAGDWRGSPAIPPRQRVVYILRALLLPCYRLILKPLVPDCSKLSIAPEKTLGDHIYHTAGPGGSPARTERLYALAEVICSTK